MISVYLLQVCYLDIPRGILNIGIHVTYISTNIRISVGVCIKTYYNDAFLRLGII